MIETKRRLCACVLLAISVAATFGACGGSDGSSLISGNPNDASFSNDVLANGDGTTTPLDDGGATSGDGSIINDGGANFGDAGTDDDGGDFPDGGTCNRTAMSTSITSDCSATTPFFLGGQLQIGSYALTKVTDLGSFTFCNNTFTAVPFQGGLVVSSASGGASDLELAIDGDMTGRKSYSWIATPGKDDKSPISIAQSCPSTMTFALPYSVTSSSSFAKEAIEIEAPYGSGGADAVYHFEKE